MPKISSTIPPLVINRKCKIVNRLAKIINFEGQDSSVKISQKQ